MKFNIITRDSNKPEDLALLIKEIGNDLVNLSVKLTEKDQIFERSVTFRSKKELKLINPTSDQGLFTNYYKIDEIEGFFCGDPDEWIPILLKDQYLSSQSEDNIAIVDLVFPENTLYIEHKRSIEVKGSEQTFTEFFVVYDKPIIPSEVHILSESELADYESIAEEYANFGLQEEEF